MEVQTRLQGLLLAALFAALTFVGAQIRLPMVPISFTLQVLFVLLSGNLLGSRLGGLSQLLYLFIGLAGLPVFAGGGGLGIILSPSFGYLCAFPVAAFVAGKNFPVARVEMNNNHHRGKILVSVLLRNCFAISVIYVIGATYLYFIQNLYWRVNFSLRQVLWFGILIFLPGDLLKAVLAALITERLTFKNHDKKLDFLNFFLYTIY
ncbi:biotin transporter BioY [candidate division KSB1 bacterium]|nr:biotin transporter BioY [bacterium]RKY80823.1 MAG: biotin transporter BioY [candidate division KSB1 bacterium]RKY92382.1 MAG: biotin transporter BioY [candidate division KSB1 bacterium]